MLSVRRHVPDKLDRASPITTTFVFATTVSTEVTLTFGWQLLMPMNCDFVASDILLFVSMAGQAFTGAVRRVGTTAEVKPRRMRA